ncbi:hypothetical protein D3C86_2220220 [compost metagenome]
MTFNTKALIIRKYIAFFVSIPAGVSMSAANSADINNYSLGREISLAKKAAISIATSID